MNDHAIESIETLRNTIIDSAKNSHLESFKLSDIDFHLGKVVVKNKQISNKALAKICKSMNVYDTFLNYQNKMDEDDWGELQNKLIEFNKDTQFWTKSSNGLTINKVFFRENMNEFEESGAQFDYNKYLDMIEVALYDSPFEFDVKRMSYDQYSGNIDMKLIDKNAVIDIFGDGGDIWHKGVDLNFDLITYQGAPFFERLICTNGMTTMRHGFGANIQQKKFGFDRVQKEINKLIVGRPDGQDDMILRQANLLSSNQISIKEFYDFKSFFEKRNEEEKYDHILNSVFSESDIFKTYGVDPKEKSKKWQSTANSGRNGYEFFNDLTWMASHPTDVRLDPEHARELSLAASELFLKPALDLQDVAPTTNFFVDKRFRDN